MAFDILFLGRLFPRELEQEIKKKMKSGMADAANALQWNIIDGLDANDCGTIKILDYLPINGYPNGYTDKTIPEYVFQHTKNTVLMTRSSSVPTFLSSSSSVICLPSKRRYGNGPLTEEQKKKSS